jgi:hypothetical protein
VPLRDPKALGRGLRQFLSPLPEAVRGRMNAQEWQSAAVAAITLANLIGWNARIFLGPSHEASIQAAELAQGAWIVGLLVATLARLGQGGPGPGPGRGGPGV